MKTRFYSIGAACAAVVLMAVVARGEAGKSTTSASDISFRNEVGHAIDKGLTWLQANQNTNGYWHPPINRQ